MNAPLKRSLLVAIAMFTSSSVFSASFNGFDVTDSLIDSSEIVAGGPPKDGIPAIDQPHFIQPSRADFLKPDDRILGISIDGTSKAYPIKILNWHEIVNDHIGNKHFAITYCPLCGTGVAFAATVDGMMLNFGVSGLLYNSDVLLYDRQTESLWSQIKSQAISGQMKGKKLQRLPLVHTRWAGWLQSHPDTLVMSQKTGYDRDYTRNPYSGYDQSTALYFGVSNQAPTKFHPKERVLGIEVNGHYKAYPLSEIDKAQRAVIKDRFNGRQLIIQWDKKNQQATIQQPSGKLLPAIEGFWFAWYAFHPDTEVFTADKLNSEPQ